MKPSAIGIVLATAHVILAPMKMHLWEHVLVDERSATYVWSFLLPRRADECYEEEAENLIDTINFTQR